MYLASMLVLGDWSLDGEQQSGLFVRDRGLVPNSLPPPLSAYRGVRKDISETSMPAKNSSESDGIEDLINKNTPAQVPDAVDGKALLEDLIRTIKTYVVVSDHAAIAVALWIINSWAYESFRRCPLLLINAPERECGKTQLLKVVELLANRPMETANISTAALFRMVEAYKPTLLIDEADMFMKENQELAGIINNGYETGGRVLRVESDGKDLKIRPYKVYGPKEALHEPS